MQNKERKGKWQPFDALEGYKQSLYNVEKEKSKIEKPILLSDAFEELDYKLKEVLDNQTPVNITYFNAGLIHEVSGVISKVDMITKEIYINNKKIKLNTIQSIDDL